MNAEKIQELENRLGKALESMDVPEHRKNIKTIHNYKIKIGKAIAKAQYDLNKNGIIFDNFNRNVNIE